MSQPLHVTTPLLFSSALSEQLGVQVWLKMEALQPSGSFKNRGVGYACQHYVDNGAEHLLASSGGNAGLAVAYAGRQLRVPVTVVVPKTTKPQAIKLIEQQQASVIIHGDNWDQAHRQALSLKTARCAYVHPFDDPLLWQGHASLIDEVIADGLTPEVVVLSVGGGGLLCGVAQGLLQHGLNRCSILAAETQGAASFCRAIEANQALTIDAIDTIATSLGAKQVSQQALAYSKQLPIRPVTVSDEAALRGCFDLLEMNRVVTEPACGASVAALVASAKTLPPESNVLLVVCGGVGANIEQLWRWRQQFTEK
ncbi:pyridoxal-phosphate dependent enzyme [Paraferrimonas haliotis]|uniref:L-serine ammonia-lyase n=1 Tax=Paraferrimonas haliotis TaxID=2013866 RepID=A0AA37TWN4_9GAMM|nr:pyridoxal-phosphate dependent enzyme [Paraferrimonas haliotis]GLS84414.1 serine/threonine dehydratase [Paraferrimonas haliotis]